ncbi:DUF5403 family protein [Streptomyces sp. AV19]|uniref:DUF5403 family protein n=1 Tax=Streptomyces sp. AV19 TaxID=2793068 RepID=UPI0018FEED10|nr:DUF5403 family protein [Streptomyces sp. AV19]MBH1936502.1 DUF5403 family protein [Streptomyces sp. AV19]MDG4532559.1 DUF5403 family protein [Streptomyces sp. AV19]
MATVRRDLASVVAHLPGVKVEVRRVLDERADRVRAVVDAHRRTGAVSRSLTVHTSRVDSTISLEDPAVLAINYGHIDARTGRWVDGIHAIEAAL